MWISELGLKIGMKSLRCCRRGTISAEQQPVKRRLRIILDEQVISPTLPVKKTSMALNNESNHRQWYEMEKPVPKCRFYHQYRQHHLLLSCPVLSYSIDTNPAIPIQPNPMDHIIERNTNAIQSMPHYFSKIKLTTNKQYATISRYLHHLHFITCHLQ